MRLDLKILPLYSRKLLFLASTVCNKLQPFLSSRRGEWTGSIKNSNRMMGVDNVGKA